MSSNGVRETGDCKARIICMDVSANKVMLSVRNDMRRVNEVVLIVGEDGVQTGEGIREVEGLNRQDQRPLSPSPRRSEFVLHPEPEHFVFLSHWANSVRYCSCHRST